MFQGGQRDPSRGYQVPPPPPPMSPPVTQLGNGMVLPPPPPPPPMRYTNAGGAVLGPGNLPPPPSGPPPGSAIGQQAPWHNTWGNRMYDASRAFPPPPPPPLMPGVGANAANAAAASQQHPVYNPKMHAPVGALPGQNVTGSIPPPPPQNEQMSATYIPGIDTYGEGVGIPGFGGMADDMTPYSANTPQTTWGGQISAGGFTGGNDASSNANSNAYNTPGGPNGQTGQTGSQVGTPLDEHTGRFNAAYGAGASGVSTTSNPASSRGIPADLAAQWPLERVLSWLQVNQFPKDWQEAFKNLELCGVPFLELGSAHGGRGNFSLMHQQVYPTLKQLWIDRTGMPADKWDPSRDHEEGRRMRHLIRGIVSGRPVDASKFPNTHVRKESNSAASMGYNLPSAGAESSDSPNVRLHTLYSGRGTIHGKVLAVSCTHRTHTTKRATLANTSV